MLQAGRFFGELVGAGWTTNSVAILVTGLVALLAAVISAWVAIVQGQRTRQHSLTIANRQQWWTRFYDTVGMLGSPREQSRLLAITLMKGLKDSAWAEESDRKLVVEALLEYTRQARLEVQHDDTSL